jgi:UDP:flavonoid glycosyltransferase YjiC (YdhE family)
MTQSSRPAAPGRILCVTSALAGALHPGAELARRLAAAGHEVVFAAPESARRLVRLHDLEFARLDLEGLAGFYDEDARRGVLERVRDLSGRRQRARDATAVDDFARLLREVEPDLLLIDGELHEQVITGVAGGVPTALLNSFCSIWRRPGLPPPHLRVRPGVGWSGTDMAMTLQWTALRLRKRLRAGSQHVSRLGCDRRAILQRIAEEGGIDLRREADDSQWLIPWTYRRLPVLSLHALEFDFPHQPPARVHYVGPMVLERRAGETLDDHDRRRVEAVFDRCRGDGRRLIYAAFGSAFSAEPGMVRRLLHVVDDRPGWELVVSLSGRVDPAELAPLPARAHLFPWLPQLEVLPECDAVVTHGGINTIDECVLQRVPMVIYCGHETDMAGNTSRVEHHEIGVAGDRRRDGTREIRHRIDQVLESSRIADNLARFERAYRAYAEQSVAERTVARLLEDHARADWRNDPGARP